MPASLAESLFDLVLGANRVATWQLERDTGAVTWDERMFSLFGASYVVGREDAIWHDAVLAEDRDRVEQAVRTLIECGEGEIEVHFRIVRPDGEQRRLAGRTRVIGGPDAGSFLFGINWDETDDLAVRRQLEEQQHLLDAAMRSAQMGSYVWDVVRDRVRYADALYGLYGYEPTGDIAVDRAALAEMVHDEDLPAVRAAAEQALATDRPVSLRFRVRRADDGALRRFELIAVPTGEPDERRMVGMVRDVTDELATLEGLRDANGRYGALVEALPDMLVRIRTDGLVLDFKPALDSRAEASDFLGKNLSDASPTPPAVTQQVIGAVRAVVAGHGPIVRELEADLPRWRRGTFECRFASCGDDTALMVVRDVTQRKEAERERESALAAAEAAARAKTVFLATVSHEMRTPLNGVLGLSSALADTALDEQQHRFLDAIQTSGRALLALVDDLLDLTRIEAGGLRLDSAPFEPERVLREALTIVEPQAMSRGLWLRCNCEAAGSGPVLGDARRLRQVLLNLIGNALKFTERGGVDVTLSRHDGPDGAALRVAVRDTGIGIPQASLETIFEAFTQLDTSAARARGGSGLGLSISRALTVAMGGRIDAESTVGTGSVFTVTLTLPHAERPPEAPRAIGEVDADVAVLLVEDNLINQLVAIEQLRGLGVRDVTLASDGVAALERASERSYDIILMDLQMPRLDGYDATRRLRATPGANQGTPVVAMTAHALDDDRKRCRDAGMEGYLIKPVERDALRPWLRKRETR